MAKHFGPLGEREFRLLKVRANRPVDPMDHSAAVELDLAVFSLDQIPGYVALSHCWGDAKPTKTVKVNGYGFRVILDVYEYLRLMVREKKENWISIDSIAINQQDPKEKGFQVAQMGDVYRNAAEVVAWLGSPPPQEGSLWQPDLIAAAQACFERMEDALSTMQTDLGLPEAEFSGHRIEVHRLFANLHIGLQSAFAYVYASLQHPYWTRLWVVQEVILARELTFQASVLRMKWRVLYEYLLFPMSDHGNGRESEIWENGRLVTDPERKFDNWEAGVLVSPLLPHGGKDPVAYGALCLIALLGQKRNLQAQARLHRVPLFPVVATFASRGCSISHDKLYGLLGMTISAIEPDYNAPSAKVWIQALVECCMETPLAPKYGHALSPARWDDSDVIPTILQVFSLPPLHPSTEVILSCVAGHFGESALSGDLLWQYLRIRSRRHASKKSSWTRFSFGNLLWRMRFFENLGHVLRRVQRARVWLWRRTGRPGGLPRHLSKDRWKTSELEDLIKRTYSELLEKKFKGASERTEIMTEITWIPSMGLEEVNALIARCVNFPTPVEAFDLLLKTFAAVVESFEFILHRNDATFPGAVMLLWSMFGQPRSVPSLLKACVRSEKAKLCYAINEGLQHECEPLVCHELRDKVSGLLDQYASWPGQ
jgi:hypothetical protein